MAITNCKLYVNGEWMTSAAETSPVYNPCEGNQIAATPICGADEISRAVDAAHAAFPAWSDTPAVERARLMFRFKELLDKNFEELSALVTHEHGKTLDESRGSVRRGIEVVEFACGAPSLLLGDSLENIARDIDCDSIRQPLGVSVAIAPFNFPIMVPLWTLPIALVCGNTFILKPSEKVPLSAIRMAKLLEEAGVPKGVFNLVHGGKEAVDTLLGHEHVKTVSFVGSTGWWFPSAFFWHMLIWPEFFMPDEDWASTLELEWSLVHLRTGDGIWKGTASERVDVSLNDFQRGFDLRRQFALVPGFQTRIMRRYHEVQRAIQTQAAMDVVELAGGLQEFTYLGYVFGLHPTVDHVATGDPATDDEILADALANFVDGIEQETRPVLERPAILIGSLVFQWREKGGEQITVSAV